MDYDTVNYNIEETNTELANYGSWSFVTVEGHSSNVVVRINSQNPQQTIKNNLTDDENDNDNYSDSISTTSSSISLSANETEPSTLLEVIDNRNKEIMQLKRINYNQKLQLNYYLKKGLINEAVCSLGRSINFNAIDSYDSINFAMARFNKVNNRKSRIIRTYDKLNHIENKIQHLLKKQESLLRKVTLDVLSSSAERSIMNNSHNNSINANNTNSDNNLKDINKSEDNFISYVSQLDLFSKLLATTLAIKRELDVLKTYSRRLISIEEERNSLVDHIYSLPVEQRLNGSYLLSVERDKAKLCLEMTNIRNDQRLLKEKISKLNHEEEYLKQTAKDLKAKSLTLPNLQPTETIVTTAQIQLEKEEKQRLLNELERLQNDNKQLEEKIGRQQQTIQNYFDNETKVIDLESKCVALEKKVETLTHQKHEQENELLALHQVQNSFNELVHKNEVLTKKLMNQRQLEDEVTELRQKVKKLDEMKEEREILLKQIEEYRYMRHIYTSIVEPSLRIDNSGNCNSDEFPIRFKLFCEKLSKIRDLENEIDETKKKNKTLAETLFQQDMQIKNLFHVIDRFGDYKLSKKTNDKNKPQISDMYFLNFAKSFANSYKSSRISDILKETAPDVITNKPNNKSMDSNDIQQSIKTIKSVKKSNVPHYTKSLINLAKATLSEHKLEPNQRVQSVGKCSSSEALKSVFGPEKIGHTTKIIETSALLSKINCHIESLEECTRGFCNKNSTVNTVGGNKSNTNLSVADSSSASIVVKDVENSTDKTDSNEMEMQMKNRKKNCGKSGVSLSTNNSCVLNSNDNNFLSKTNNSDYLLKKCKLSQQLEKADKDLIANRDVDPDIFSSGLNVSPATAVTRLNEMLALNDDENAAQNQRISTNICNNNLTNYKTNNAPASIVTLANRNVAQVKKSTSSNIETYTDPTSLNTASSNVLNELKEIQQQIIDTLDRSGNPSELCRKFKELYRRYFDDKPTSDFIGNGNRTMHLEGQ